MPTSSQLPPLNALRAFECAARHLSFTRAADELHVTPAAVGHQIRQLEDWLGVPLFVRLNRAVRLTDSGRAMLPGLGDGFERLRESVDRVVRLNEARPLMVSVVPSFAGKWLMHRIDRFRAEHPDIEVRIDATIRIVDLHSADIDLAIRYGSGHYPGLRVDCLLDDEVFPVCSPTLLEGEHPLRTLADLRHHVLLQADWRAEKYPTWPDWTMWLKAAGLEDLEVTLSPAYSGDVEAMLIDAAIRGQGVALTSRVLVEEDLAAGRLVRPFDLSYPLNFCYYVVRLEQAAESPRVRAFRQWLLREVGRGNGGAQAGLDGAGHKG
jgi:LysR family glycine cleavage system transcriptional activator